MVSLDEQLGALLVSLARARQIADLQSAAIAEQYRQHPLLEGLSVPRVRVPELVIDLPILVETQEPEQPNALRDADEVAKEVLPVVDQALKGAGVGMPSGARKSLADTMRARLSVVLQRPDGAKSGYVPKEGVVRSVEESVLHSLQSFGLQEKLGAAAVRGLAADVRRKASEVAEATPGVPARLNVSMLTHEVKDKASSSTVARLRIVLREEGLDWSSLVREDGTSHRTLVPE